MPTGELGRGTWQVVVGGRGGAPGIGELPWRTLSCGRLLDGTSSGTVVLPLPDPGTILWSRVGQIREWQHEVALYRDETLAWVGPVVGYGLDDASVTLQVRDLSQWLARRRLRSDHDVIDTDAATIFASYVADAMSGDTSPGLTVTTSATNVVMDAAVLAAQYRYAMDELSPLARAAVDWTVVGRTMLVGGQEVPTSAIADLYDEHFVGTPTVSWDGLETGTDVVVTGPGGGADGFDLAGHVGGVDPLLGLVDLVGSEPTLDDQSALDSAAVSKLALVSRTPFKMSGRLSPSAPVTAAQLVPGARFGVVLGGLVRPVSGDLRLASVGFAADSGGEKVTVDLIPLGTVGS